MDLFDKFQFNDYVKKTLNNNPGQGDSPCL